MGTDVSIHAEYLDEAGEWQSCDYTPDLDTALSILEVRNYFMYAMWAGIRNYYGIVDGLFNWTEFEERPKERQEYYEEYHGLNQASFPCWDDDVYRTHAKFNMSELAARDIALGYDGEPYIFSVDDLCDFDYNAEVQIDESKEIERDLEPFSTYMDNLPKDYDLALRLLRDEGVGRLLITFC